ncbi:MAG: energy-coupling factor ABC transporter substrate-binding protein [Cyanobacteria bacterium]|nr:energy-coupling factor ABC transporter substrate-binding protein [Cyanobacteriota bacterium]
MKKIPANWSIAIGVLALSIGPLLHFQGNTFNATDSKNSTAIEELRPGYKPWFKPVIKPSGGEIETFLFATQAAIGAGIVGYVIGLYKGRSEHQASPSDDSSSPQ